MECKLLQLRALANLYTELIDTLWNVNDVRIRDVLRQPCELIDTLWNVNTYA